MIRAVFCFLLIASGLSMAASGELSNRRAPGFALPDPAYEHYYDLQDFAGKVVLIDIMSTRCPHCLLLSTTLEQVKARYGNKVAILEVVLPPDSLDTVSKFVATNKVTIPVVCDMGQMTASYFMATPATMSKVGVPHLFLIDKQGIIRNDFAYEESTQGVFEGAGLFPEIDKLLK
jgi:peroxiredoxin